MLSNEHALIIILVTLVFAVIIGLTVSNGNPREGKAVLPGIDDITTTLRGVTVFTTYSEKNERWEITLIESSGVYLLDWAVDPKSAQSLHKHFVSVIREMNHGDVISIIGDVKREEHKVDLD